MPIQRLPRPVRWLYALLVVLMGWVLLRTESVAQALGYFGALAGTWQAFSSLRLRPGRCWRWPSA